MPEEVGIFSELMSRHRELQLLLTPTSLDDQLIHILGHQGRSLFFKPTISLILPPVLYSKEEYKELLDDAIKTGNDQHLNVHVISDGRKAYVQRV